jgi:hypothetical protein
MIILERDKIQLKQPDLKMQIKNFHHMKNLKSHIIIVNIQIK